MTAPTPRRALTRDPSLRAYDQSGIALFVAQLDDQLRRLEATVAGLDVAALERQPAPGRNSAGMLLAHIGMTEVFWTGVAAGRTPDKESAEAYCREVLGVGLDDDGMPIAADGRHPAVLAGWDLARYADVLHRARRHLKSQVCAWRDADLAEVVVYDGREFTREWVLCHLIEHLACHAGQIGLVLAIARRAG